MKFWQPFEHVSVDERMVQKKGRYSYRQFMKDNPTKWGMKGMGFSGFKNGLHI